MTAGYLLPNAGAQGEFTGIQMIAAYHRQLGDDERTELLFLTMLMGQILQQLPWQALKLFRFERILKGIWISIIYVL